jgi:sugar O-acyltransferase (sialic acid O-acetyltransferase NeuD family)
MRDLVLVGAGGFARETAQMAGERLRGFLDDDPAKQGTTVDGVPVLGDTKEIPPDARVVVCVGSPRDPGCRARLVDRLGLPASRYATLVHPTAWVSASSSVGPGSVLLAQVVLTASVRVGAHVAIMPHVTLTHDDEVDDFATVASGVRLAGGVRVGRGAYLGSGALVREGLSIGPGALIGMGAVVTRDVPAGEVWAGNPARPLSKEK